MFLMMVMMYFQGTTNMEERLLFCNNNKSLIVKIFWIFFLENIRFDSLSVFFALYILNDAFKRKD